MIYIISILRSDSHRIPHYRGFETCSESVLIMTPKLIKEIIENTSIKIANATIKDNAVMLTKWVEDINTESEEVVDNRVVCRHYGAKHIIIAIAGNKYKVVDNAGKVVVAYKQEEMLDLARRARAANCRINGEKLETLDTYNIKKDEEFEKLIAVKYNSFLAKTKMLGLEDVTFNYTIENHEVTLVRYTGSAEDIILPPFITSIRKDAFRVTSIKTLKLNEGLKIIGSQAFARADIARVDIPSTVELIGTGAFRHNNKLFTNKGEVNTDRFKLLNNKTIVLDQSI